VRRDDVTATPDYLTKRCQGLIDGAGAAIDWIGDVRTSAPRLDRDADGLIERLRRSRNLARRLSLAAGRPMSIGFFGASQAGKSYLISSLARGGDGTLKTDLDGERLDFIDHINPPGGGKEATGLVTRFTRQPLSTTPGYPVRLSLLNEADVIKILGNSFLLDFNREQISFELNPEVVRDHLKALETRRQPRRVAGLDEDDVVDLAEYFERRFKTSNEPLAGVFWPTATGLAPFLSLADRAQLFSLVWGRIADFSQAYLRLAQALERLGQAAIVHAPLTALVERGVTGFTQGNSIMNVDAVRCRFGYDEPDPLGVRPVQADGSPAAEVRLSRSLLAALTREMAFRLADPPQIELLDSVDLLDFPGYRGRMGIKAVAEAAVSDEGSDPVGTLLLRGKVAYLFERYTDDQEMNVLVMCNPSDKQIEISALGPVIDTWVSATQGASPAERGRRPPGLLWALTMFDKRLQDNLGQSDSNLELSWKGMLTLALLERFGKAEWLEQWAPGRPFDSLLLVRKPGMSKALYEIDAQRRETALRPEVAGDIERLRTTFLASEAVRRHIAGAEQAWAAMIACDDGGLRRVVEHLREVALIGNKLARIEEQISHLHHEIVEVRLGAYFRAEGADEVERKKKLVELVVSELRQRPTTFGEVLRALQSVPDHLRSLYLKAEDDAVETLAPLPGGPAAAPPPAGNAGLISLDAFFTPPPAATAAAPSPAVAAPVNRRAALFAKAVISDWLRQLRHLPENEAMLRFLGLGGTVLRHITDEIITGALRFNLEEKLVQALHEASNRAGATRSRLVDQQVLVATTIINDFIDTLGFGEIEPGRRPRSLVAADQPIFQPPPPIPPGHLPRLGANPLPYSAMYIVDWFEAFKATAINNAGHAAGSEITPEQNERLGRIIAVLAGASLGAPQDAGKGA